MGMSAKNCMALSTSKPMLGSWSSPSISTSASFIPYTLIHVREKTKQKQNPLPVALLVAWVKVPLLLLLSSNLDYCRISSQHSRASHPYASLCVCMCMCPSIEEDTQLSS